LLSHSSATGERPDEKEQQAAEKETGEKETGEKDSGPD
jgi:hypothetical protein